MDRRGFLAAFGAAVTTSIAGCQAPAPGGTTNGGGTTTGGATTGGGTATGGTQTTGTGGAGGAPNSVDMVTQGSDYYFDPIGLFVEPGETISFVIDSGAHSSVAYASSLDAAETTRIPEGAEPWDSGILSDQGASFDHTFQTTGTYDYFCLPHKTLGMVGRLVVGEPGGPAEGSMPPDGDVPASGAIVERGAISYDEFTG